MSLEKHLLSRHVDLNLHKPVIDEVEGVATFFLYNLSGQLVGYQQYRPSATKERHNDPKNGRYFTYRVSGHIGVFGLESVKTDSKTLYVTEGIFDAVRLTEKGCAAIAVLSNNPSKELKSWFKSLPLRTVAVCDNDSAGRMLAKFCDYYAFTQEHDLGDSSDEFVTSLISTYGT